MTQLTKNFSLAELTRSQTAIRKGLENKPDADALRNLVTLAGTMELVRAALGVPVHVLSGYRSPAVNAAVGGSPTSAHRFGLACDFTAPSFGTPYQIVDKLQKAGIPFDQLIHEFGEWVHIGLAKDPKTYRKQVLTAKRVDGKTRYLSGNKPV